MAFTELNFVPGEVVTAAKMNLLAANDVWLRENSGGMKFSRIVESNTKTVQNVASTQTVHTFSLEPNELGKKLLFVTMVYAEVKDKTKYKVAVVSAYLQAPKKTILVTNVRTASGVEPEDPITSELGCSTGLLDSTVDDSQINFMSSASEYHTFSGPYTIRHRTMIFILN